MAATSSAALSGLILCCMTLLALAARPVTQKATQGAMEQQAVPDWTSQGRPPVLRTRALLHGSCWPALPPLAACAADPGAAARKLLASTPTFDRDLEDRSKYVVNPTLEAAYKRFEAAARGAAADDSIPFRRLLAKAGRFYTDKALKERSPMATNPTNPTLEAAYKRFEAIEAAGAKAADTRPFKRRLVSVHYRGDVEDRTEFTTSGVLDNAYKSLQAAAATGSTTDDDSIPFRRLLASTPTFDRDLEDRSAATTNPTLTAAVKRLEEASTADDSIPFRRLLASSHISDRDLEDRSAAVTTPLLRSAYKKFEADQAAGSDSNGTPFRKLLAAALADTSQDLAAAQPAASH